MVTEQRVTKARDTLGPTLSRFTQLSNWCDELVWRIKEGQFMCIYQLRVIEFLIDEYNTIEDRSIEIQFKRNDSIF